MKHIYFLATSPRLVWEGVWLFQRRRSRNWSKRRFWIPLNFRSCLRKTSRGVEEPKSAASWWQRAGLTLKNGASWQRGLSVSQSYTQPGMNYPVITRERFIHYCQQLDWPNSTKALRKQEVVCGSYVRESPVTSTWLENAVHGFVSAGVFSRPF